MLLLFINPFNLLHFQLLAALLVANVDLRRPRLMRRCSRCYVLFQVNPQLFSTREKEQMRELIDTMLAYNLSYRQDRTPEGQYTYILEP